MKVLPLVGAILGLLVLLCAILAVSGVNRGWLERGGVSCGTIKCKVGSLTVKIEDLGVCKKTYPDGAKATLALSVISMVLALGGTVLAFVRAFEVFGSKMFTMLSAILFVVVMILLLASWAVYIGVFIKGCCSDGCSVDGGYSFGAAITGMIIAIPTFIILFIAASKDEK